MLCRLSVLFFCAKCDSPTYANMENIKTPHIEASENDFAKTVLMPGDPLRSKFIAENFLAEASLINNIRGVQGYTGNYKGNRISVMASGMGMPSIAIYSYELYEFFGVENIIRIGSAGALQKNVKLMDIVVGMSASTDSSIIEKYGVPGIIAPTADYMLLDKCIKKADALALPYHVGNILSSDVFYGLEDYLPTEQRSVERWSKMGILAVEMEAAALYLNAKRSNKNALAICTVSNHLVSGEEISAKEREQSFTQMIELALETAAEL